MVGPVVPIIPVYYPRGFPISNGPHGCDKCTHNLSGRSQQIEIHQGCFDSRGGPLDTTLNHRFQHTIYPPRSDKSLVV